MPPDARRRVPAAWHVARWTRDVPGRAGLAALAAVPVLFFAPYRWTGLFREWQDVGSAVLVIGIVLASLGISRDVGAPEPTEFWMHQRGFSLADWALSRWLANIGLMVVVAAWWTACYAVAARMHGLPLSLPGAAAVGGWLVGMFTVISALLLLLGSVGRGRAVDAAVLVLIATALLPALEALAPGPLLRVMGVMLPPLHAMSELRGAAMLDGGMRAVVPPLLHTCTWLFVVLALATALFGRRRPTAPRA